MPPIAGGYILTYHERRRLAVALRRVRGAGHCRRLQAVWLVADGHRVGATASLLNASRRWVTKALACYRARRCPQDLAEGKRSTQRLLPPWRAAGPSAPQRP